MLLPASDIHMGERVRQHLDDDIRPLCQSIDAIGQLQPVLIDNNNTLICGARRVRACELLQRDVWAEQITGLDELLARLRAEQDENTCRKPFTPSEMVEMGAKIEAIEKPKAAERKKATQGRPAKDSDKTGEKFTPVKNTEKTRDKVAKALGVSGPTYDKAKAVVAAAEKPDAPPEVVEAAKKMDIDGKVDKAFKAVKAAEQRLVELPAEIVDSIDLDTPGDGLSDFRNLMSETSRIDDAAITRFAKLVLEMDDVGLIHSACKLWVK